MFGCTSHRGQVAYAYQKSCWTDAYVEFYMVLGSRPLLLGNSLWRRAVVDGPEGLIEFIADSG
jgi:hypothetical protein